MIAASGQYDSADQAAKPSGRLSSAIRSIWPRIVPFPAVGKRWATTRSAASRCPGWHRRILSATSRSTRVSRALDFAHAARAQRRDDFIGSEAGAGLHHGFSGVNFHMLERSEEHTSELQSLRHLVCRLSLEKKKSSM